MTFSFIASLSFAPFHEAAMAVLSTALPSVTQNLGSNRQNPHRHRSFADNRRASPPTSCPPADCLHPPSRRSFRATDSVPPRLLVRRATSLPAGPCVPVAQLRRPLTVSVRSAVQVPAAALIKLRQRCQL